MPLIFEEDELLIIEEIVDVSRILMLIIKNFFFNLE